ncbi:MAG TPA: ABC transporter permease, partial [Blastocatellia bacterium]|nr:ABC transporter permease [Blastocatellia bacterium]
MILKEVVLQAVYALISHRSRAMMTMLGIAWGIVTVVLLMAYGNGFHRALMYGMHGAFSDGVVVTWNGQTSMQAGGERAGRPIRLKEEDVDAIREMGVIKYASPELVERLPVTYGTKQTTSLIRGVAPEYALMRSETAEIGRFINSEDMSQHRRTAFLGYEVAKKLFGNSPAVGEEIRINGMTFEVVGVMVNKVQMSSYFSPDKYCVFIPYNTVSQVWNQEYLDTLVFQTVNPLMQEDIKRQVRATLAARHGFDPRDERAVTFNDSVQTMQMVGGITNGLK